MMFKPDKKLIINVILPLVILAGIGISVWGISTGKFELRKKAGFVDLPEIPSGCKWTNDADGVGRLICKTSGNTTSGLDPFPSRESQKYNDSNVSNDSTVTRESQKYNDSNVTNECYENNNGKSICRVEYKKPKEEEPTCMPRPACLDERHPCLLAEPVDKWCSPTPLHRITPIPKPSITQAESNTIDIVILMRLSGVAGTQAHGANVLISLFKDSRSIFSETKTISSTTVEGVYLVTFTLPKSSVPAGNGYYFTVKGEKHVQKKYCVQGQTQPCKTGESLTIANEDEFVADFTTLPIDPGDLYQQDGVANITDYNKVIALLSKACADLTATDKLTADLDYNGCIDGDDIVLMRKTLETQYDQN